MEGEKSITDRLSSLPDSVLGYILSFLSTNNAVATSILSKRWKFVWATVNNLDFTCMKEDEEGITEFVQFVNRVLLLNGVGLLNKFSLNCCPLSISPQIIPWINNVITRNVCELRLSVGNIDIPTSLFTCKSLRSLGLSGVISIYDTLAVCLPRLESLEIDRVRFESEDTCDRLIRGCPIVHYLNLHVEDYFVDPDVDITCTISSTCLRRVEMYFEDTSKLKLNAPSLEYLILGGRISEIFVEKNLSSLVVVSFDIDLIQHDNNSIVEAVRAFHSVKNLSLSADVLQALCLATISLSTEFKRLVKLVAEIYCCPLQDFIQNSENLEIIYQHSIWPHTIDLHHHPRWTTPVQVPKCLSNKLKKVCFWGYKGLDDEYDMICDILKYGNVLEVMDICCYDMGDGEKLNLLREISEFPRKSPVCKVRFS